MVLERGEIRDPELAGVNLTVTEIRVSPDMRNATVFVVPLGGTIGTPDAVDPAPGIDGIIKALKRARPYLRHRLAQEVVLRHVPDLSFQADTSFDEASHIDGLLRSATVARDLEDAAEDDGDDGA